MATQAALQVASRAWCTPKTERIEMDPVLAEAVADLIVEETSVPLLGNATNADLINELAARIEIHWDLNYSTVSGGRNPLAPEGPPISEAVRNLVAAAKEALEEIEYWHGSYLREEKPNGWKRVTKRLREAVETFTNTPPQLPDVVNVSLVEGDVG